MLKTFSYDKKIYNAKKLCQKVFMITKLQNVFS